MRYIRPLITTASGEAIVDAIGPASASTSGVSIPQLSSRVVGGRRDSFDGVR